MKTHRALNLQADKLVVFAALSQRNFSQAMLISRFVFEQDAVPINPFTNFGYYLYELVDRDVVRNGNNNLLKKADELWVFGEISDGVEAEIIMAKEHNKPIHYFDISKLPDKVTEIAEKQIKKEK